MPIPRVDKIKPQESPKKNEFRKMLEVVENVDDKKAILEILKKAMDRGVVRNPKAYLAGIINSKTGNLRL